MLLYVDKKAEKRHKIKIICILLCVLLFIYANILHIHTALNFTQNKLDTYKPLRYKNTWYNNTDTIILFSSAKEKNKKIILLPQQFTKQTALTLLWTFQKISAAQCQFLISDTIKEPEPINKLLQMTPSIFPNKNEPAEIILTTDISPFTDLIKENHLYPAALTYTTAQKTITAPEILSAIEKIFPSSLPPKNELEKEKQSLEKFLDENDITLKSIITNNDPIPFSKQYLFFKNLRLCLKTNKQLHCQTTNNLSLKDNIINIKKHLSANEKIKNIILLTSDKEEPLQNDIELSVDEGLHFLFNGHEAFIFPNEIKTIANKQKATYIVKQRAGINPEYSTKDMKFYKFKTVEVNLE